MMTFLALLSLAAWIYLNFFHGRFWRADQRLGVSPSPASWPRVVAIIPARNESETIGEVVAAHMAADYAGEFSVVLVDDNSTDDTAERALQHVQGRGGARPLTVIDGAPLAEGWTGKLWAVHQGLETAQAASPDYILLTDADIVMAPHALKRLVAKAEAETLSLVSLMARLDARGFWGGLLVPAFIYFFQKLYPFPRANDPNENTAAAAGGCMLVRVDALDEIGGVAAIRDRLIDDCALARAVKDSSPAAKIWIGLAENEAVSRRDNRALQSIWNMVARTAYAQLNRSPALLAGTVIGMALIYLAPPVIALSYAAHGDGLATGLALLAWGLMARTYWPTLRLYGQQTWQSASLPVAAAFYAAMTAHSAIRDWRGEGGQWKGRRYEFSKTS